MSNIHGFGGNLSNSSSSSERARRAAAASSRFRSFSDINNAESASSSAGGPSSLSSSAFRGSRSPSNQPTSDDDDDYHSYGGRQQPEDFFTGGEKSGLAVQNPDGPNSERSRLVRDILQQAERGGRAPPSGHSEPAPNRFSGRGHMLGVEDAGDQPETVEPEVTRPQSVTRTLTFWRDGFSIENGALMRYDDPANQEVLRAINSGRAPVQLLNVSPGQPVDVRVERRMTEDFVQPSASQGGFFGSGHRLGA
ncbi:SEP domain-containing protein [Limtongia smithiae]|uniref:SEP domain-containing protein n=1 Tax=Limtongia smithiae TaxID=1125753 RepID=UPI0034CF08D0